MTVDRTVPSGSGTEPSPITSEPTEALSGQVPGEGVPVIPDYSLVRRLAAGGFGEVWLAKNAVGMPCAIKILFPGTEMELELEGLRTYMNYARMHAHLVTVHHLGVAGGRAYYVMDLADGYGTRGVLDPARYEPRTLAGEIRRRGGIDVEEAVRIFAELLSGLKYLHDQDLLHRDIKPANVVFVDGRAQLTDIGLVKRTSGEGPQAMTPLYAPPEGVQDRSGDLYCLAKSLYEAVTNTSPKFMPSFPSTADTQRERDFARLAPVLHRACHSDSERRFKSCAELDHALRKACPKAFRRPDEHLWIRIARFFAGHVKLVVAFLLLGLVVACAMVAFILYKPNGPTEPQPTAVAAAADWPGLARRAAEAEAQGDHALAMLAYASAAFAAEGRSSDAAPAAETAERVRLNRLRAAAVRRLLHHPRVVVEETGTFNEVCARTIQTLAGASTFEPPAQYAEFFARLGAPFAAVRLDGGRTVVSVHQRGSEVLRCEWVIAREDARFGAAQVASRFEEDVGLALGGAGGAFVLPYSEGAGLEETRRFEALHAKELGARLRDALDATGPALGILRRAALSPDGSRAALVVEKKPGRERRANQSFEVQLLDAASGAMLGYHPHADAFVEAAFAPDGSLLAILTSAGRVLLFSAAPTAEKELVLLAESPAVSPDASAGGRPRRRLAFWSGPGGSMIAAAGSAAGLRVWRVERTGGSEQPAVRLEPHAVLSVHPSHVLHLAVSVTGGVLHSLAADGVVRAYDLRRRPLDKESTTLGSSGERAAPWRELEVSPRGGPVPGDVLASGAADGTVQLWSLQDDASRASPHWARPFRTQGGAEVTALGFAPDGKLLLVGAADRAVHVVDAAAGELLGPSLPLDFVPRSLVVVEDTQTRRMRAVVSGRSKAVVWLELSHFWLATDLDCADLVRLAELLGARQIAADGSIVALDREEWLARWRWLHAKREYLFGEL